ECGHGQFTPGGNRSDDPGGNWLYRCDLGRAHGCPIAHHRCRTLMRFRLHTLMIVLAIGPPVLAAIWLGGPLLLILGLVLVVGLFNLAVAFVLVLPIAWLFAMAAKALLHYGRHPDNRQ